MGDNLPLVVKLEVIVPLIILPDVSQSSQANPIASSGAVEEENSVGEVRLFAGVNNQEQAQGAQSAMIATASAFKRSHSVNFHFFSREFPALPQVQTLFLQVFRRCGWLIQRRGHVGKHTSQYQTETMTFSLTFQSAEETARIERAEAVLPEIIPGVNQIIVQLDGEGTPVTYSVDGAEG